MSREFLEGTTSPEFTLGKGDHNTAGQPIAGIRTSADGFLQAKHAGRGWYRVRTKADHTLVVATTGGDFDKIQDAIDSITVESQDDYWCIWVMPGIYVEDVVLKDNVDLQGIGGQLATIEGSLSWPVSTCTDGWWSNVDNITVQNSAMGLGDVIVSVEAGWHYMVNSYVRGILDGTSGTLIGQSGGALDLLLTALEYDHTGAVAASGKHTCVVHSGGIFDSFQSEYWMSIEDTDNEVEFYRGHASTHDAADVCRICYAPLQMYTPAGYISEAEGFCLYDGSTPLLVQNNDIRMEGTGGTGVAYAHSLKSNTTLTSSGNTILVNGYQYNYRAFCEDATSVLGVKFNSGYALDGFTGLGAQYIQYIFSGSLGSMEISGNIQMVPTATVDGRDVSADGSAVDNLVTHAIMDNQAGEIHAIIEKALPVDDDEVLIEDSADGWTKKRVKKSAFGGLSQHAIDSTSAHSAASDNTNFNASTTAHGFLPKLDDEEAHFLNGKGQWVIAPSRYRYHEYSCNMTGVASNTYGLFSKAPPTVANPSGIPTTTPYDVYVNGAMAPWMVTTAQNINTLDLVVGAAAVSQATVGTNPTARIDVYNNLGGSGAPKRTLLGTYRLPVVSGAADIKNYNDLSGTALIRFRLVLGTTLALTEGMLLGFEFVNETTDNTTVNAIKAATLTATAVSISETPTGYQLTVAPTAPTAPNTGDVWVDNS